MKKFIIHIALFSVLVLLSMFLILRKADGYTDPFYVRFTTPKQHSLILGSSKAAQGILPQILNSALGRSDMFNYSFTIGTSPYGPTYLQSIKNKLDYSTKDAIFILAVDAWSISSDGKNPNDIAQFKEKDFLLGKTNEVNQNPNISYLLNSFDNAYYEILLNKYTYNMRRSAFLHQDGWLEVSTLLYDSLAMKEKELERLHDYQKNYLPYYQFSQTRLAYLEESIDFLKEYGKVYLVRLPVSPLVMEVEDSVVPDLDKKMEYLSVQKAVPYINLSIYNANFLYTDGIHLHKQSGAAVSRLIAEKIKE